jgi:hypothetical protein
MAETAKRLDSGQQLPHFVVATLGGERVDYRDIWQRRNLLLVALDSGGPSDRATAEYVAALQALAPMLHANDTQLLVTADPIGGVEPNSIVIADRWGEIMHVANGRSGARGLPPVADLLEWLNYVRIQCPECPP